MNNKKTIESENEIMLSDIQNTQKMCQLLMQTPHYKKYGAEGVFAVVEKAKSVGVNPLKALNGAMYYVRGKVEMSSTLMNDLIRSRGHSIQQGDSEDDQVCVLIGKRADNGDTWTASFSIAEAKLAGIYQNQWHKYPRDMLFARALSRLGRQLFPDVISGCYVEGEIENSDKLVSINSLEDKSFETPVEAKVETASKDEIKHLEELLKNDEKCKKRILDLLKGSLGLDSFEGMPKETYEKVLQTAMNRKESTKKVIGE